MSLESNEKKTENGTVITVRKMMRMTNKMTSQFDNISLLRPYSYISIYLYIV